MYSAFLGGLGACVVGGILIVADVPQQRNLVSEVAIYSVVDNKGLEGNFALGYGNISDTLKYSYIIEDDLGKKVSSIDAEEVHIVNVKSSPKLKTYITTFKNRKWDLIGINFIEGEDYVLEVPENTIKYDYNIDLK